MPARPSSRGPVITRTTIVFVLLTGVFAAAAEVPAPPPIAPEAAGQPFRLLNALKSTLERDLNEAAAQGYVFTAMMDGKKAAKDKIVVVMSRRPASEERPARYKVLAAEETSTLRRQLEAMGAFGFRYRARSTAGTSSGGLEAVVILERDAADRDAQYDYRLVAAAPASNMQSALSELTSMGFEVKGLLVSKTALGTNQVVTILSRRHGRAAGG